MPGTSSPRNSGSPKDRLTATVYVDDDEAFDLWKKIAGLPESRIIRIAGSDNFWAMGDTGPCGPCSEIFYDHGEGIPGGPPGSPDADGDRFIEIWNLVFMQFEQVSKDERINLPKPAVDTGMGLERTAAVLQGVHDNYDIDLFRTLIAAIHEHVGRPSSAVNQASPRVIADHLRATSFLIADGVLPSNEGRGYVLRRIMRRAMRHAHLLGAGEPAIFRLVPTLVHEMGQAYPELGRAEGLITETLRLEEGRFLKTLARGISLLEEATGRLKKGDTLDGETAFKLYDTYGFPLDLTQDALKTRGIGVDLTGFTDAMERQRAEARASWAGSGEAATESVWLDAPRPARRDGVPGLRHGARRSGGARARQGRRRGRAARRRRGGRDRRQPDAVLRRVGRAGRRHRHDRVGERRALPRHRHAEEGGRPLRASRQGRGRRLRAGAGGAAHGRRRPAQRDPRATIRRRIFFTRRCARRSARTSRRKARSSRRTGCASISRIQSRCRRTRSRAVEDMRQRRRAAGRAGRDAARWIATARSSPARWRSSAKNTATRCASSRWARRPRARRPERPIRSSSAAARMSAAPARSGWSRSSARPRSAAGVRRVEALTGAAARKHLAEQDKRVREIAGEAEGRGPTRRSRGSMR